MILDSRQAKSSLDLPYGLSVLSLLFWLTTLILVIALRLIYLDSDAYARLSWSSALLTDEGFYLHNARNLGLFGHLRTDGFNNCLIMPLLHLLQVGVFRLAGVGLVQARLISVGCSLLSLGLFYAALHRAFGTRVALLGLLLLGLDHVNVLYNRLALMDTPGALLVVGAFFAWVKSRRGEGEKGRRGDKVSVAWANSSVWWLVLCGLLLGVGYTVRGLVALVWLIPLVLLWWERREFKQRVRAVAQQPDKFNVSPSPLLPFCLSALWYLVGLGTVIGVYALAWWWPHRVELQQVNHYYIVEQLMPHSARQLGHNIWIAILSWNRGLIPYLIKHTPVQALLAAFWLGWNIKKGRESQSEIQNRKRESGSAFLAGWLLIFLAFFCVMDYAPSRYFVLFYPALAGLAALAADRLLSLERPKSAIAIFLMAIWWVVNACWLTDWLTHISYQQRDADRWLGQHLPGNAVVLGAVAPGLCINNRLRAVNVIEDLCNDHKPVEQFAPAPRYILILDDRWKEVWWMKHYPSLVAPNRRAHAFRHILRPFFVIGLYPVPPATINERSSLTAGEK